MDVESLALAPPLEQALRQVTPHNWLLGAGLPWGLPGAVEAVLSIYLFCHHSYWGSVVWHRGTTDICVTGSLVYGGLYGDFPLVFCSFTLGGSEHQERKVRVRYLFTLVSCHAGRRVSAEGEPQLVLKEAKFRCA